ncbi:hypothetical protein STEG23_036411, partial [Scotinomys teguina]
LSQGGPGPCVSNPRWLHCQRTKASLHPHIALPIETNHIQINDAWCVRKNPNDS